MLKYNLFLYGIAEFSVASIQCHMILFQYAGAQGTCLIIIIIIYSDELKVKKEQHLFCVTLKVLVTL